MRGRLRIAIVSSSMSCGGAERVIATLANRWAQDNVDVSIVTLDSEDSDHYSLDSKVRRIGLDALKPSVTVADAIRGNLDRTRRLKRSLQLLRPSVVISFQDIVNVLTLVSTRSMAVPVVVSDRNDPARRPLPAAWRLLKCLMYRTADAIVVQTPEFAEYASRYSKREKIFVIPNPIPDSLSKLEPTKSENDKLIAVGRLVKQKGFDLLLEALPLCQCPWKLTIAGDGPERSRLEQQAKALGICERVTFSGLVINPIELMRSASVFVLPSRWEGLPNVVLEAVACGLPVVAFDCGSGPREIVRTGEVAKLVRAGDLPALAAAIDHILLDDSERSRLLGNRQRLLEEYSESRISSLWMQMIESVTRVGTRVAF